MTAWTAGGLAPHAGQPVSRSGAAPEAATCAAILLHGRGGSGEDMLGLAGLIAPPGMAVLAPNAAGQTWYPFRFLEPPARNEPGLSSALAVIEDLLARLTAQGLPAERIALAGFSQGACLALEFASRHAGRLGAVIGLSGGLIGDRVEAAGRPRHDGLPVFLGCAEHDPHIPIERVLATQAVFETLGAAVVQRTYPGSSHGINANEISEAKRLLAALAQPAPPGGISA